MGTKMRRCKNERPKWIFHNISGPKTYFKKKKGEEDDDFREMGVLMQNKRHMRGASLY